MAIGALFCVKILRCNAKHVVTLNANAMENRLPRRRSVMFRGVFLRLARLDRHAQILAQHSKTQHLRGARRMMQARTDGILSRTQSILDFAGDVARDVASEACRM
jgi:hypothetical protein